MKCLSRMSGNAHVRFLGEKGRVIAPTQPTKSGVHYVITLYKADKFSGEMKSSEEGRVYWIPLEELKTKELATGMEHVLQILESEQVDECYMHLESDGYVGDLY